MTAVIGSVWSLEKRTSTKDWDKRVWGLTIRWWSVVNYGVDIWRWKEKEVVVRLNERYLRWVLGMDRGTAGYLVR